MTFISTASYIIIYNLFRTNEYIVDSNKGQGPLHISFWNKCCLIMTCSHSTFFWTSGRVDVIKYLISKFIINRFIILSGIFVFRFFFISIILTTWISFPSIFTHITRSAGENGMCWQLLLSISAFVSVNSVYMITYIEIDLTNLCISHCYFQFCVLKLYVLVSRYCL